ncbi:MAG: hypothetical protein GF387_01515 [Candidatus Portnoybacteria bacterium]|nr:hypothetical protein [Candidatus Portnoybacteria bacterium]
MIYYSLYHQSFLVSLYNYIKQEDFIQSLSKSKIYYIIKSMNKKIKKIILSHKFLIIIAIILIIANFFFVLDLINKGRVAKGTTIATISISGLSQEKAIEKLKNKIDPALEKEFKLKYQNQEWPTTPKKLGIDIDAEKTIQLAFEKTHQDNFLAGAWWQLKFLLGKKVELEWEINKEKVESFLLNNLASIHSPAKNSTIIYDQKEDKLTTTESKAGIVVNKEKVINKIKNNIENKKTENIQIELIKQEPEATESETETAKKEARKLLTATPFKLIIENEEIATITKEEILSLVSFRPIIDPNNSKNKILGMEPDKEKIKNYLTTLAPLVNTEPINAQLTIKDGRVTTFALSKDGKKLKIEESINPIAQGINSLNNEIRLKIEKTKAEITTENIDTLGIDSLLAKGVSDFTGSPSSRVHNIKTGTAKFHGYLIKPDQEFSFNEILGEVGPEQGYLPELVIKRNETVPEYGGGLCQVSTTLFRAAINAGLEITERYHHAFPVKYYNPQGFDATIYPPSPDLKFINNTPGYILIQGQIKDYKLIFELYGTSDDRRVVIEGPYQYDIQENGAMKARLTQKVYDKNEELIINKTFYSNYRSPDLYPVKKNPLE